MKGGEETRVTYIIDIVAVSLSIIGEIVYFASLRKERHEGQLVGIGICVAAVIVALPNALWCLAHLS